MFIKSKYIDRSPEHYFKTKKNSCLGEVLALIFVMVLDLDGHLVESADTYSSMNLVHFHPQNNFSTVGFTCSVRVFFPFSFLFFPHDFHHKSILCLS